MKQRLGVLLLIFVVVVVLIGLNVASYQQKQKTPDSEMNANRSSFNPGATGTQAWFTLLAETGRHAVRWQDAPASLLTNKKPPSVFVVVGFPRQEVTANDAEAILTWTRRGGRLVLVDREPNAKLIPEIRGWKMAMHMPSTPEVFSADPADQSVMTAGTEAVKPAQPSLLAAGVNAIQPSKFVQSFTFERSVDGDSQTSTNDDDNATAPIVQFAGHGRNVVVEVRYGDGEIVYVSDPYIVTNAGISLADNAQLAANLVATNGTVAFDEYHQGYNNDSDRFLQFFAGTPVVAIFLQAVVIVAAVFFSQSRRFARAVPEPEPDRLTKLEYIAAMAELQQRTRAWDLAIENIYADFKRRASRLVGLDATRASSDELAKRVAERTGRRADEYRETFFKCEEIVRGEPTSRAEVLRLTGEIRAAERELNLRRGRAAK